MNRTMLVILAISIIGNLIGLFVFYKYWTLKGYLGEAETRNDTYRRNAEVLNQSISDLTAQLDKSAEHRLIFLHHSVGKGLLDNGGLRQGLMDMGILVKGATYGDEIGEDTDMNHWVRKFREDMDKILRFSAHPDRYNNEGFTNDIIMFKSCFPNSDIIEDGVAPGEPDSPEKTLANYKAVFASLKTEMAKYPDKLFVYLTAPPRVPEASSPDNAGRARKFNDWLIQDFQPAYAVETGHNNFYVFDLFGTLAGADNFLKMDYRLPRSGDSHPNLKGSRAATEEFIKFFRPLWTRWQNQRETIHN